MAGIRLNSLLRIICRIVVSAVFILAAVPKISDPVAFASSIDGYRVISGIFVNWVALMLPWLELAIGFGILTPWIRKSSAMLIAALLNSFIALHASAWARGLDIDCGCFGDSAGAIEYHWLILRNLALLFAVLYAGELMKPKSTTPDHQRL